jgi:hypothetical protein
MDKLMHLLVGGFISLGADGDGEVNTDYELF